MNLEENLRAAIRELAADAPPAHGLAAVARTRGRRLRRRRQAVLGAAVVALVAVAITPYAVLHRSDSAPRPVVTSAPPAPRPSTGPAIPSRSWWTSPVVLPGGAVVTAVTRTDVGGEEPAGSTVQSANLILDRATGRYTVLDGNYYTVWGSPKGNVAAVDNGSSRLGLVDPKGTVKWLDVGFALDPQWSPDGSRLLLSTLTGFAVVDVATRKVHRHAVPDAIDRCPDWCLFTWLPDGEQVAVARRDASVPQSEDKADKIQDIAVYDAGTARRVRLVPVPGVPSGTGSWSPDGRTVLIQAAELGGGPLRIADTATGRIIGTIAQQDAHFLPDGRILALDDQTARLSDAAGRPLVVAALPADFQHRTLSIGTP